MLTAISVALIVFEGSFRVRLRLEEEREAINADPGGLRNREVAAQESLAAEQRAANQRIERDNGEVGAVLKAMQRRMDNNAMGIFDEARPDWMPIEDAPFKILLMPQFYGTEGFWPPHFYDRYLSLGERGEPRKLQDMTFDPGVLPAQDKYGREMSFCAVDWEGHTFKWGWSDDDGKHFRIGLALFPWELSENTALEFVTAETWANMKDGASFAWRLLRYGPNRAVQSGEAMVMGAAWLCSSAVSYRFV